MDHHPDLAALSFLVGEWDGEGRGAYPTIETFKYRERISFKAPPGKNFIAYTQQTWRVGDDDEAGAPLHTESGYVRPDGPNRAELVLAQPSGIVEVHHGAVSGTSLSLRTGTVATTSTAKDVRSVERNIAVSGDRLDYEVLIGAVGQSHQLHLTARLARVR